MVELGTIYRHYKTGLRYLALSVVKNSKTLEDMILYQAQYGDNQVWVIPLSMWEDEIPKEKITDFKQSIRFKRDYKTFCEFHDIAP